MDSAEAQTEPLWFIDRYGCHNLRVGDAVVWISVRPSYCDRGHYQANVHGVPGLDSVDAFPRYFMDLQRAKNEMRDWLLWRLKCNRANRIRP